MDWRGTYAGGTRSGGKLGGGVSGLKLLEIIGNHLNSFWKFPKLFFQAQRPQIIGIIGKSSESSEIPLYGKTLPNGQIIGIIGIQIIGIIGKLSEIHFLKISNHFGSGPNSRNQARPSLARTNPGPAQARPKPSPGPAQHSSTSIWIPSNEHQYLWLGWAAAVY